MVKYLSIQIVMPFLIIMVLAADGTMFLYVRDANGAQGVDLLYRTKDGPIPLPEGFTSDGARVGSDGEHAAGLVVRYAAAMCPYCRADRQWVPLSARLQRRGYRVVFILPFAKDRYADKDVIPRGAPQEAYISMEWIRHFRLTLTPTVLMFGPHQNLVWAHQGVLSASDVRSAIHAAQAAGRRSE